jgi:hypothetical protein
MHGAFIVVLFGACGIGIVASFFALASSDAMWHEYETRGLVMESFMPALSAGSLSVAAEEEIRQMLEASNSRRARRGEPLLDIDGEVARLTAVSASAPGTEPELH